MYVEKLACHGTNEINPDTHAENKDEIFLTYALFKKINCAMYAVEPLQVAFQLIAVYFFNKMCVCINNKKALLNHKYIYT